MLKFHKQGLGCVGFQFIFHIIMLDEYPYLWTFEQLSSFMWMPGDKIVVSIYIYVYLYVYIYVFLNV